jgi:hypothetical protein
VLSLRLGPANISSTVHVVAARWTPPGQCLTPPGGLGRAPAGKARCGQPGPRRRPEGQRCSCGRLRRCVAAALLLTWQPTPTRHGVGPAAARDVYARGRRCRHLFVRTPMSTGDDGRRVRREREPAGTQSANTPASVTTSCERHASCDVPPGSLQHAPRPYSPKKIRRAVSSATNPSGPQASKVANPPRVGSASRAAALSSRRRSASGPCSASICAVHRS